MTAKYPILPGPMTGMTTTTGACTLSYRAFFEDLARPIQPLPTLSVSATLAETIAAHNALIEALKTAGKMKES